jgi:hypothetical protein
MKTLSQLNEAAKAALDIQDDSLNFIGVGELKKYKELTQKFISDDAKYVVDWLIDNNATYVKDFGGENALASFYNKGVPKDANLKALYKAIGNLNKRGRLIEIPVFQNDEQFNGILNQTVSPDEIFLDLTSERGRNMVAKKYTPLIWKIARSMNGKSALTLDELVEAGNEGLTWAMNEYGKKSNKRQKLEAALGEEITDMKKYKAFTFLSFAGFMIKCAIMEAIKNESHLVRIPVSQQNKERAETGRNTKSNSVSGDQTVGHDSEGNGKSLFDYMDDGEKGGKSIDDEDIEANWKKIYDILDKQFDKKTMEIFYTANGLRGYKQIKKIDIAKKYDTVPSNITAVLFKVMKFIQNDKKTKALFTEILELMHESESDSLEDNHYIKENLAD